MDNCKLFSNETQNFIYDTIYTERRNRKSKINEEEMIELLEFTQSLVERYKNIMASIEISMRYKIEDRKENIKHYKSHFEISKNDYYLLDNIFNTNRYNAFPKVIKLKNGKTKKRFKEYSIQKVARIFYIAYSVNTRCVISLLQIPDIHFAVTTIKKDEFGDLEKYMTK